MDTDEVATLQAHPCEVVEPNCFLAVEMRAKDVSHMTVACQGREKADCRDHRCSHHVEISADRWPDDVRLSDIEPGFVCTACGWVNSECGRCNVSFAPKPTDWCAATNCRQVPIGDMVRQLAAEQSAL